MLPGDRFGVVSYENPSIRQELEESSPAMQLLAALDELEPWAGKDGHCYKGKLADIEAMLTDSSCDEWQANERLLKRHSLPYLLRSIEAEKPERIGRARTGTKGGGRYWLIYPPKGWAPAAVGDGDETSPEGTGDAF
jgi:hypothetical protein